MHKYTLTALIALFIGFAIAYSARKPDMNSQAFFKGSTHYTERVAPELAYSVRFVEKTEDPLSSEQMKELDRVIKDIDGQMNIVSTGPREGPHWPKPPTD